MSERIGSEKLSGLVESYLKAAVYRMFRVVYSVNPKNEEAVFTIPKAVANSYACAKMAVKEANASAVSQGAKMKGLTAIAKREETIPLNTERINQDYPQLSSSLFNLIQNSENFLK